MILALTGFPLVVVSIIAFILILGLIIIVHEGGHFFFAKKAGILCHEFSIGMGPAIWKKKYGETLLCIRAIPIGGYVSMADEVLVDGLIKKTNCKIFKKGKLINKRGDFYAKKYTRRFKPSFIRSIRKIK